MKRKKNLRKIVSVSILEKKAILDEDLSSKTTDKLLIINKTSPTLNTLQIDPSHLILNIQLNYL
ncbi:hypothetical protein CONCODRAFT_13740 [Conidiobolus coronatus NRRL 28638]|uniref:Uncharacterized protein n=1 Tax=Conidiobolus coronatus (strain ATCC 28846 / CBS 209.66 / NRRL 28638) TaxID=796925 RepID=A0A137NQE0_CONC2|nr:hypothetical protein CONCODRAFT_13740 [Conidiobolus coronatus NRRL 28638]|eukprot:KXN64890.1 hypothetical protein CONCODRAFT_13740 [Conidiobolus coronatus NRRL 28638]